MTKMETLRPWSERHELLRQALLEAQDAAAFELGRRYTEAEIEAIIEPLLGRLDWYSIPPEKG